MRVGYCIVSLLSGALALGCFDSHTRIGADVGMDSRVDIVPEIPQDTSPDPTWDTAADPDGWDVDTFEFDGYSPPECSFFTVYVEWDVSVEEPYVSTAFFEASDEPMLSVFSLYEASDCPHHTRCAVTLHVARTYRPVILVLSSYEPVEWVIDRDEGARIDRILVTSHYESTVSGAGDVTVEYRDEPGYVGYCWPRCGGHDTAAVVMGLASSMGVPLASFYGGYNTHELKLWHVCREECREEVACAGRECGPNDCGYECGDCPERNVCFDGRCVPCTPDCSGRTCGSDGCDGSCGSCPEDFVCLSGSCVEAPYFTGCDEVTGESHYCMTLIDSGPAVLGLDTGIVCPIGKHGGVLNSGWPESHSIALLDGYIHVCVDGAIGGRGVHGLMRASILDGSWEVAPVLCYALARHGSGLIVQPDMSFGPFGVVYYPDFEHVRAEDGTPVPGDIIASRLAVNGDTLYASSHSTDTVERYRLLSGSPLGEILLEGYDTWIQGMSVTDDGLLVCNANWPEDRIAIFDSSTGAHIRDVHPIIEGGSQMMGLICMTNP